MKLQLHEPFVIEIDELDMVINGYSKKLTKKQEAELKKKFKSDLALTDEMIDLGNKLRRMEIENKVKGIEDNEKLLEITDRVQEINETLKKNDTKEKIAKYRFGITVESGQLEDLIKLADDYGYSAVLEAIGEAVREGKQKGKGN